MRRTLTGLLIAGLLGSAAAVAADSKGGSSQFYRWIDEDGNVHYGDRVPAEYSGRQREIINDHGVTMDTLEAEPSEEERQRWETIKAEEAAQQRAEEEAEYRDQVLLRSYTSVNEIEALRDRRVDMMDAQIKVTEIYLDSLREKLTRLEKEASRYSPYSDDPKAEPLDEELALEISSILESIMAYEDNLAEATLEQGQLMARFNADIDRYKELRGE